MNIVVCVKQVPDTNIVTIEEGINSIDREDLVYTVNPYDILAVEEAVRIKEREGNSQVNLVSMGTLSAKKILRRCLAIGADKAILLRDDAFKDSDSYATATILAKAICSLPYDLIFCGQKAADTASGQVGAAIAEMLDITLISGVIKVEISPNHREVVVQRKMERGNREVVRASLPALLTVEAGLNEPRYASLPSLMEALRKDIEEYNLRELGLSSDDVGLKGSKTQLLRLSPPRPRLKKPFTPDSNLPAAERMRLLVSGGIAKKESNLLEGAPEEVASKFIQFLNQQNIIT
ncbi:electron transfer flavoprotein subunit beta/FixA family protein [Chloroflexota bacterium]